MIKKDKEIIEELRKEVGYTFNKKCMKDSMGRFWTQGLFKEMSYGKDRECVIMTLKNEDFEDLTSFKRVFVELGDPSGYLPAMVLLDSWDHWLKLCDCPWFKKELELATDELEVKLRAEALIEIKEISQGSSGSALQAARYIASGSWKTTAANKSKAGNFAKGQHVWTVNKEKDKEEKISYLVRKETNNDYERLGLGKEEEEALGEVEVEGR